MKRLGWITDIHLDHLTEAEVTTFGQELAATGPDGILISGDIAVARTLVQSLHRLADAVECPLYFVCGNHDYYYGSIVAVRRGLTELSSQSDQLCWLPAQGCVALTDDTGLVGHGCWNDGRAGSYRGSTVMLTDYLAIAELTGLGPTARLAKLNQLGDEAAAYLAAVVPKALDHFAQLIVLTHAPPFVEATSYEGRISGDDWLPHLTCLAAGQVLARIMESRPDRRMTVLSGHTHNSGTVQILPNLLVKTGGATYGKPEVQEIIEAE
ncbi:MAG: phosphoesterase [Deltaproteobacteria bacterium]|nr:MAG: phosphoesterase [Deltaproteobacteria bacterium]